MRSVPQDCNARSFIPFARQPNLLSQHSNAQDDGFFRQRYVAFVPVEATGWHPVVTLISTLFNGEQLCVRRGPSISRKVTSNPLPTTTKSSGASSMIMPEALPFTGSKVAVKSIFAANPLPTRMDYFQSSPLASPWMTG